MQIDGPWLVVLSVALLAATMTVVALARRRVWTASGRADANLPELDTYEIAYLNGGPALVATTAAANLLRAGHLAGPQEAPERSYQDVHLQPVTAPPAPNPVEQATYELVAGHPDRRFRDVQKRVADTPAAVALRERLRGLGLVLTADEEARYRGTVLWFLPLLALAAARMAAAVSGGSRDAFPFLAMVVLAAVAVTVAGGFLTYLPTTTPAGCRALEAMRQRTPRPEAATVGGRGLGPAQLGLAVALYGAGVLWTTDAGIAAALEVPREAGPIHSEAGGCGSDFVG